MAATTSYSSLSYHHSHNRRNGPSPNSSPLPPTYSPLSSGLPSPSFPSPSPLPQTRGRSPTPTVSRYPSRQQSVRRLSTISLPFTALSRTPTAHQIPHFVGHHDFSMQEEVLQPGDIIGQGESLHGELIDLVPIQASAPRLEPEPAMHLQVVRKLGAGSYAVVYLVREITSRVLVPVPRREMIDPLELTIGDGSDLMEDRMEWKFEYGREFAVKCLSKASLTPEELAIQMFEATIHQSLPTHPNIVTLYRTLQTPSFLLLILESVPGQDLYYFLEQSQDHQPHYYSHSPRLSINDSLPSPLSSRTSSSNRLLPPPMLSAATPPTPSLLSNASPSNLLSYARLKLITSMFAQMCDAVEACHIRGVSHRDIKPENFIVTEGGANGGPKVLVKLSDFGLATLQQESADVDCGSAPYMSYECRNNVAPMYATQPADVWSLGIVLINMLYHHNPWSDTATLATTQAENRRHAMFASQPIHITTFTTSSNSCPHTTHTCLSFTAFLASPTQFFLTRFPGMTPPVADFLANHVFCLMDGGQVQGWGRRCTPREFGEWVRRLPMVMGQGSAGGLGLGSGPVLKRPSMVGHERRTSRLASEMTWPGGEEETMEDEERVEVMLPLEEKPQQERPRPPSTSQWDEVILANGSSSTLVKPPSPVAEEVEEQEQEIELGIKQETIPEEELDLDVLQTAASTVEAASSPTSDSLSDPNYLLQSARSPSSKRRGKRGARRKDKSQPPPDGHSAAQSPLLLPTSPTGLPDDLDLLANNVESLANKLSNHSRTSLITNASGKSRLSAAERALARLPPPPSMPPPPPPTPGASVAAFSALGKRLSQQSQLKMSGVEATLTKNFASGIGFPDMNPIAGFGGMTVPVPIPQMRKMEKVVEDERESQRSPPPPLPQPAEEKEKEVAPSVPVQVVKKTWRSRFGLNSSSSSSSSAAAHATPSALESPIALKTTPSQSSLRNEVARGPAASQPSSKKMLDPDNVIGGWSVGANTSPRVNDLYPSASTSTSPSSPSPLNSNRARAGIEGPSWRNSVLSTSTSSSYAPSTASSTFTRFSNSSNRSVSTMATSAHSISMKSDAAASWRDSAETPSERPRPRKGQLIGQSQSQPVRSNVKRMDGMPSGLDELRTTTLYGSQQPQPRVKGVLSNTPSTTVKNHRLLPQQGHGARSISVRSPQQQVPYEPVVMFPAYLNHRKPPAAGSSSSRLDSIAETTKNDLSPPAAKTHGSTSSSDSTNANSEEDKTVLTANSSAKVHASSSAPKPFQKKFWGLKR